MNFQDVRKLHQKKFRDEFGHFLVEGEHPVQELEKAAARDSRLRAATLYLTSDREHWRTAFATQIISNKQMAQLSDTHTPQGIVAVVPILPAPPPEPHERAVYLHEIQDPGNLGTVLRSLGWFGKLRCLLSPGSVDPHNSKVVRASAGAIFQVPFELDVELDTLRARYQRIACLDMSGTRLPARDFNAHECFVFGNEARGLPRETLATMGAQAFSIAGGGIGESLNLAAAVNICLYELNR